MIYSDKDTIVANAKNKFTKDVKKLAKSELFGIGRCVMSFNEAWLNQVAIDIVEDANTGLVDNDINLILNRLRKI